MTFLLLSPLVRRMFPSVRVKVRNLDPCQQYYVAMDVMPVDSKRYRCVSVCIKLIKLYQSVRLFTSTYTLPQVCVPQLAVDGGWKHGPLLHLSQALRAPGLAVRRGDVDASGHQL